MRKLFDTNFSNRKLQINFSEIKKTHKDSSQTPTTQIQTVIITYRHKRIIMLITHWVWAWACIIIHLRCIISDLFTLPIYFHRRHPLQHRHRIISINNNNNNFSIILISLAISGEYQLDIFIMRRLKEFALLS